MSLIRYNYSEITLFSIFDEFSYHVTTHNRIISRCPCIMLPISTAGMLKSVIELSLCLNDRGNSVAAKEFSFMLCSYTLITVFSVSRLSNTVLRNVTPCREVGISTRFYGIPCKCSPP